MILIADCSALIALSVCDSLHLLDALFGTVLVPETVYREATESDKPEAIQLARYLSDKVRSVDTSAYVYLDVFADAGETHAMLLYKQLGADRLLIDDKRGRKVARNKQHQCNRLARCAAWRQEHRIDSRSSAIDRPDRKQQSFLEPGLDCRRA